MSMYRLSKIAENDLLAIADYGDEHYGVKRSNQYRDELKAHFEMLAAQPHLFQSVEHIRKNYRRSVCGAHAIYYRITDDGVEIMALIRGQNPQTHLPDA